MSTYVIRAKCFGYNDEVFYVAGNRIANIFQDKAQAEQAYKQLEIDAARNFALYEVEALFNASEEKLNTLDAFVFERCGQHIADGYEISEDTLPAELADDDTFEFVQRAGMQSYQLMCFEGAPKFYALWSVKQQELYKDYDEYFTGLVYAPSPEQLKGQLERIFDEQGCPLVLNGTLESLSSTPALLQAAIASNRNIVYKPQQQQLEINNWDTAALYSVNALLNNPLFEIREISLEDIQHLEAGLAEEEGYDDY